MATTSQKVAKNEERLKNVSGAPRLTPGVFAMMTPQPTDSDGGYAS